MNAEARQQLHAMWTNAYAEDRRSRNIWTTVFGLLFALAGLVPFAVLMFAYAK